LIGPGFAASNSVTRDLQISLRDLPDPIAMEFAAEFQVSTAYHPVSPGFFERMVTESMKLPPRLWRIAIEYQVEYDDTQ